MHYIWSGSISFGLITIPVHMYSAAKERALDFDMLRKKDLCPIAFQRVCKADGQEVPYEDIVKGYKVEGDRYIVLEESDFQQAAQEKSDRIDIEMFVLETQIDTKYYSKPYYLEPEKGAEKAYVLLREVLSQSKKVGVAKIVFRAREDLVILKPDTDLLMLIQLRYTDEIRIPQDLKTPHNISVSRPEIAMAIQLVEKMEGKFDPEKYHDTYVEKLKEVMKNKAKGVKPKVIHSKTKTTQASSNLVAQLKASLEHT